MQHELNDNTPCGLGDKSGMTGRFANNYFDGIPVRGVKALAYTMCGALAGLAGVVLAARITTGTAEAVLRGADRSTWGRTEIC